MSSNNQSTKNILSLDGKTAIVTGASSGLGAAIALLFAEYGAKVVALARREDRLKTLAKQNSNIVPVVADVTKSDDLAKVMDAAKNATILVNNAGIMDNMLPVGEMTDEVWDKVMAVNLRSVMSYSRAFIQNFQATKQQSGSIINIASASAVTGGRGGAAYVSSKHAVIGLTENTAYMYATEGIRCNAICPGSVGTEIVQTSMQNPSEFGYGRAKLGMGNIPRFGTPDEVANLALFLASDASSLINGAAITADAGWTAY